MASEARLREQLTRKGYTSFFVSLIGHSQDGAPRYTVNVEDDEDARIGALGSTYETVSLRIDALADRG